MDALVLFVFLLIILYLIYVIAHRKFNYWAKKNVPYVKPLPFLGNYGKYILLQDYPGHVVQRLCRKFPDEPYFGAFYGTEPVLVVKSPELLKNIFTKDFVNFYGREVTKYETKETVTQILFFSSGDKWKVVRQNLTPMFSSMKMRNMFHLIDKCCCALEEALERETCTSDVVEVLQVSTRFAMDSICSCSFGVEANTLSNPTNNPFKIISEELFKGSNYRGFKIIFRAVWPAIFYSLGLKCFPDTIETFFGKLLKDVFQTRNYKPSGRNDFVDIMLSLKNESVLTTDSITNAKTGLDEKYHLKVDDDVLVSQCIVLFAGGFETSSTVLSFTLYELAKNPAVQARAIAEVDEYMRRHGNKLNYECMTELPYLNACMQETMRMYPVIGNLTREVMDDCVLPDGLSLNKGVRIHIPVYHLHYNPDYFPEPEAYRPERFSTENKGNIKPFTYLPFGEGPRFCIGKRFASMQVLSGLVTVLKKYRVEVADNMPETINLEARTFLIQPRGHGIMLKLSKRKD